MQEKLSELHKPHDLTTLSGRVAAAVAASGRKPAEISRAARLSPDAIRDLTRRPDQSPKLETIQKLALELKIDAGWLAYRSGPDPASLCHTPEGEPQPLTRNPPGVPLTQTENLPEKTAGYPKAPEQPPTRAIVAPPIDFQGEARLAGFRWEDIRPMTKDLPVLGTAAGALSDNGFEITPLRVELVRRPPALDGVPDAYGLYVIGESNIPLHKPGDLILIHPHRPYRPGDSVVIQTQTHEGAPVSAFIKIFRKETAEAVFAEQLNPPAVIEYKKTQVLAVHKVLPLNELFGV